MMSWRSANAKQGSPASLQLYQVDAFTDRAFAGNPAAVCLLDRERPAGWLQQVAAEMNLSETAFLLPRGDGGFDLRWFTPQVEVDLCGHATLASAHTLWETGGLARDAEGRFQTRSGELGATRDGDWIELDFPLRPIAERSEPDGLLEALGINGTATLRGASVDDWLIEVEDESVLRRMAPDYPRLARLPARGFIVTCAGSGEHDFLSRFFAPAVGVDEDPVTGSAHCTLAPFWAARLGRDELIGQQVSARGGTVRVRVAGDRVRLAGQAVTVWVGELTDRAAE